MRCSSSSYLLCCFFAVLYTLSFGVVQVWASTTTVTPFSFGGKAPEATPQQASASAEESTKQAIPAPKPLFVKEEEAKPKAAESAPAAKPLFVQEEDKKTQAPASAEENAKQASPAAKPLFVKEEDVKPKAAESAPAAKPLFVKKGDIKPQVEKSSARTVEGGSSASSFAVPLAPANKKPGKAILIPSTKDVLALTTFTSDGQADTCLRAIALQASPLVAVRLESMGGKLASWKTRDVKASAQGVLAVYQGENFVNANDASFSLNIAQPITLDLCVQDGGALKDAQTKFRIIFFHADGTRTYTVLAR